MKTQFEELDARLFAATIDEDYSIDDPLVELAKDAVARVEALEDALFGILDDLPAEDDLKKIKSVPALRTLLLRVRDQLDSAGDE